MFKILMLTLSLMCGLLLTPTATAQAFVSVRVTPPPLPVYAQPPCPVPGYLWTPGYWAWSAADGGYFWVPGTWVLPPQLGYLWTPGYWAWNGTFFVWRSGYWGPTVGFYGGIDYGYGYIGTGYYGGYWRGRHFYYNRAINNVNVTVIHNTYRRTVVHRSVNRVSYNGGHGGSNARPGPEHRGAHERRIEATHDQSQQRVMAQRNRAQFNKYNHGRPGAAATARPGAFQQHGPARGGASHPAHPDVRSSPHKSSPRRAPTRAAAPRQAPRRPITPPGQRQGRPQSPTVPLQAQPHRQSRAAAPAHRAQQRAAPARHAAPQHRPQSRPQHRAAPTRHHQAPHEERRPN